MSEKKIIDGVEYMADSRGNLVMVEKIKDVDLLRDEVVDEVYAASKEVNNLIGRLKKFMNESIDTFLQISAEQYEVSHGGKKGNVTLTSFDGSKKVQVAISDVISFDERLQTAKELIDRCLTRWSNGANSNLKAVVNNAFRVDKQGKVDSKRILELRRLNISDEDWDKAMEAINDSIQVMTSKRYIRVYERVDEEKYVQITLDFSAM